MSQNPTLTDSCFIKNIKVPKYAWPTIFLALSCLLIHPTLIYFTYKSTISLSFAFIVNTLVIYCAFTPLHDVVHGSIASSAGIRGVNDIIGVLCSLLFPMPYFAFKHLHLTHHKFTNDYEKDPDMWVISKYLNKYFYIRQRQVQFFCCH